MTRAKHCLVLIGLSLIASLLPGCSDQADRQNSEKTGIEGHESHDSPAAPQQAMRIEFFTEPAQLMANRPATWNIRVLDAQSGKPVEKFAVVHDKLMHLIIASKDLSWFNHVHPEYQGNGLFKLAPALVPQGGKYKLYADYTPQGGAQDVAQHEFEIQGEPRLPDVPQLTPDKPVGPWLIKQTKSKPEGMPDVDGKATYEVALMLMPARPVPGEDTTLHFRIRDSEGKPVKDLEPYLAALGHVVILSQDGQRYLHSHPVDKDPGGHGHAHGAHGLHEHGAASTGGPDVMFHSNFPEAGLYKAWGQFMHDGLIITAEFTFEVSRAGFKTAF